MFKKVFAVNTNFDCHDLDITNENKILICKEAQVSFIFMLLSDAWLNHFSCIIPFLGIIVVQVYKIFGLAMNAVYGK